MDWSFRENWDEYSWAREIRKDELRIAGYFRTLPGCLDLPGEDEMIFKRLMSQPEMVPTGVTDPNTILRGQFDCSEDEIDEEELKENRRRNNFEATRRLENLAVEWNLLAAARFPEKSMGDILSVTCAFGKVLSRGYNFEDTEDAADTLALRISLLKYMLADLNDLAEAVKNTAVKYELPSIEQGNFFNTLALVREIILDRLKKLRLN